MKGHQDDTVLYTNPFPPAQLNVECDKFVKDSIQTVDVKREKLPPSAPPEGAKVVFYLDKNNKNNLIGINYESSIQHVIYSNDMTE